MKMRIWCHIEPCGEKRDEGKALETRLTVEDQKTQAGCLHKIKEGQKLWGDCLWGVNHLPAHCGPVVPAKRTARQLRPRLLET